MNVYSLLPLFLLFMIFILFACPFSLFLLLVRQRFFFFVDVVVFLNIRKHVCNVLRLCNILRLLQCLVLSRWLFFLFVCLISRCAVIQEPLDLKKGDKQ